MTGGGGGGGGGGGCLVAKWYKHWTVGQVVVNWDSGHSAIPPEKIHWSRAMPSLMVTSKACVVSTVCFVWGSRETSYYMSQLLWNIAKHDPYRKF